jgi:hypothetical protein
MLRSRRYIATLACVVIISVAARAEKEAPSYKVIYDGGSLPEQKAGTGMKLFIDPKVIRLARDKSEVIAIPVASITEISYGQDVHRRVRPSASAR